jgi:hypothetical protein
VAAAAIIGHETDGEESLVKWVPNAVALATGLAKAGPTALWAGAMFRSPISVEISGSEIRYDEALADGNLLAIVRTTDRYPEATDVLHRCGGEYLGAY